MNNILELFAMAPQDGQGGQFGTTLIMFALIILIFYFMILRPQQKRQKERQKLLDSLKRGDKVITVGGIHGTIVGLDEKTVILEVTDRVELKIERSAVSAVIKKGED